VKRKIKIVLAILFFTCLMAKWIDAQTKPNISEASEACLGCHSQLHPGIVADWRKSRHANFSPAMV